MGIFSFQAETHEMVLDSSHPGVSVEQISNETGWPVQISSEIHETIAPSRDELSAVRKYDPKGVWTS
jgi:glutaconate CoA-transferase subunit B